MSNAKPSVHFRRIGWRDTLDVIALSRSLLPPELCRKTHSLFALFVNFERQNTNLSFGLYVEDKLVGYMLVYFLGRSLYYEREERIVHIDEYCVMPGFRGRARDVIGRMLYESNLFQQKSGIEAIATGAALEHWMGIGRVVAGFGYETKLRENDCERAGHSMGRIRWEFKADEKWRPDTPMKLPKPMAGQTIDAREYELLTLRNPRQWLTLGSTYAELAGEHGPYLFNYAWQWWRHFGISEELKILAVQVDGNVQCIVALSVKPAGRGVNTETVSPVAENSDYPTCAVACAEDQRKEMRARLHQLISDNAEQLCRVTGNAAGNEAIGAISNAVDRAFEAPQNLPQDLSVAGPRNWFGLNRREYEIHRRFQGCVSGSD